MPAELIALPPNVNYGQEVFITEIASDQKTPGNARRFIHQSSTFLLD